MQKINKESQEAAESGLLDKEKYIIPPHLHDLQEADLPETQRGLVISEIAQFRERAAKREREKMREIQPIAQSNSTPSGPKAREWGRPAPQQSLPASTSRGKPGMTGFVKAEQRSSSDDDRRSASQPLKTDEEMEQERKEIRKHDEEVSFKDVRVITNLFPIFQNLFSS